MGIHQTKSFFIMKELINRMNTQLTIIRKKYFQAVYLSRGLYATQRYSNNSTAITITIIIIIQLKIENRSKHISQWKKCKWPTGTQKNAQHHLSSGNENQNWIIPVILAFLKKKKGNSCWERILIKENLCTLPVGIQISTAIVANSMEVPQKP